MNEFDEELNSQLYKFADYIRHHERTGLGGPDNQPAIIEAIKQAVAKHIIGEDVNAIERNSYAQITKYDEAADHQSELRANQRQKLNLK